MGANRRSVLKGLFGVPLAALAADWLMPRNAYAHERSGPGDDLRRRLEAVDSLRAVNTAQRRYLGESGTYGQLEALASSMHVGEWVRRKNEVKAESLRSLFDGFARGASHELAPDWTYHFALSDDGRRYLMTVTDNARRLTSFATDQEGVIYEGSLVTEALPGTGGWPPGAADSIRGESIGKATSQWTQPSARRWVNWLAAVLVTPVYADHCPEGGCCCWASCCHDVPCDVTFNCSCITGCSGCPNGWSCENCGCVCCTWKCCREIP